MLAVKEVEELKAGDVVLPHRAVIYTLKMPNNHQNIDETHRNQYDAFENNDLQMIT